MGILHSETGYQETRPPGIISTGSGILGRYKNPALGAVMTILAACGGKAVFDESANAGETGGQGGSGGSSMILDGGVGGQDGDIDADAESDADAPCDHIVGDVEASPDIIDPNAGEIANITFNVGCDLNKVIVQVFLEGQQLETLVDNKTVTAGPIVVPWPGTIGGQPASSGIYELLVIVQNPYNPADSDYQVVKVDVQNDAPCDYFVDGSISLSENPFNPINPVPGFTYVHFTLDCPAMVTVTVIDDSSATIVNQLMIAEYSGAGQHSTIWNGTNTIGSIVAPGTYRVDLVAESFDLLTELDFASTTVQVDY